MSARHDDERYTVAVGDPLLEAIETLPVGSAKVPRLPIFADLLSARDDEEALRALVANGGVIAGYADELDGAGHHPMAGTVRRALKKADSALGGGVTGGRRSPPRPARLGSDTLSLLELIYAASLKTAGVTTMTFAPWVADRDLAGGGVLEHGLEGGRSYLRVASATLARLAEANAAMYVTVLGALNEAVRVRGCIAPPYELTDVARSLERDRHRPFAAAADVKSMAKIDYKIGGDGRPIMVDLNAGLIGARFDDDLLAGLGAGIPRQTVRIAARLAQAITDIATAHRGAVPRRVALVVLDEQMYETWRDADMAGLVSELHTAANDRGTLLEPVPVLTMAALVEYARHIDDPAWSPEVLGDDPWRGTPQAIVFYTGRVGQEADPRAFETLRNAGIALVDECHHALLAAKAMADPGFLPAGLLGDVAAPDVIDVGCVEECTADSPGPVERSWEWAAGRHDALAIKIEKARRAAGPGDHATAFIFPVTDVGRRVAERQIARAAQRLCADGWGRLRMNASPVDLSGGLPGRDGLRFDVEVRTYAFPGLGAG